MSAAFLRHWYLLLAPFRAQQSPIDLSTFSLGASCISSAVHLMKRYDLILMKMKGWQVGPTFDADPCCGAQRQTMSDMNNASTHHSATPKQAQVWLLDHLQQGLE